MASVLKRFKILIADQDRPLADVSKRMLEGMGFSDITVTPSGAEALDIIKQGGFDFLITDWQLKEMDGITLINRLRRDNDTPNRTMPIIMLTGRMEQADVHTARDHGIHEYVVKPFSAQTIYNRLERIVEYPRPFVIGNSFVGPDRRIKDNGSVTVERRRNRLKPQTKSKDLTVALYISPEPQLWQPDFSLKSKLGHNVSLDLVITPSVLRKAQAAIDAMTEESLHWIKEDLDQLTQLKELVETSQATATTVQKIRDVALSISARSGTFGYKHASKVAYMLYLFFRSQFHLSNKRHHVIFEKHLQVLQVIFGKNIRSETGEVVQIVQELKHLTEKYVA